MSDKCLRCGNKLSDTDTICLNCGSQVVRLANNNVKSIEMSEIKKDEINYLIVLLSVFFPIVGIVAGVVNFNTEDKKESGTIYLATGIIAIVIYMLIISAL